MKCAHGADGDTRSSDPASVGGEDLPLSIVIPTYKRDEILLNTVRSLAKLSPRANEILVIDQTGMREHTTESALRALHEGGTIRWIRLSEPSIPAAMNRGLLDAKNDVVLFLDDDIEPFDGLVAAHVCASRGDRTLIAGRVLQPWDRDVIEASWSEKGFASTEGREINQFMGGNFSVARDAAISIGGFDENFVRVAYNFEREFARRWQTAGGAIQFRPDAAIWHLKAPGGGTRTFGSHLTTLSPGHAVGAYYCLLRSSANLGSMVRGMGARLGQSVATRHHLRKPWWIPATIFAELAGIVWAVKLYAQGPKTLGSGVHKEG